MVGPTARAGARPSLTGLPPRAAAGRGRGEAGCDSVAGPPGLSGRRGTEPVARAAGIEEQRRGPLPRPLVQDASQKPTEVPLRGARASPGGDGSRAGTPTAPGAAGARIVPDTACRVERVMRGYVAIVATIPPAAPETPSITALGAIAVDPPLLHSHFPGRRAAQAPMPLDQWLSLPLRPASRAIEVQAEGWSPGAFLAGARQRGPQPGCSHAAGHRTDPAPLTPRVPGGTAVPPLISPSPSPSPCSPESPPGSPPRAQPLACTSRKSGRSRPQARQRDRPRRRAAGTAEG